MAQVENLKIGNTSYEINDKKALHQWNTMPTASADYLGVIVQYVGTDTADYKNGKLYKCEEDDSVYSWNILDLTEVYNGLDSTSETAALSAYMGNVLAERIDNIGTIGRFLAMWDADTGIARYLDIGFVYERGDYFIIASTSPRPTLSAFYHGSQTIKGTYPEKWKEYFPDVTINTTLTYDSSNDTWYNPDRTVILDGQEILELVRIDGFTAPDEGDYIGFNYVHDINYMPSGDTYTGPSTTAATDDLRLSDMYYYDGEHWVYMANHEKQIAVDAYLDKASLNPVENRVLANKIEEIETDIDNKQDTLVSGTNIKTVNDQSLLGAGNIEIQGGAGAGYPCIVDVNSKQIGKFSKNIFGDDYNGQYTYMQFTTNLDKEQLVEKMNDLYVTISRRKRQTQRGGSEAEFHPGSIAKMVVQNDQRFKLNKKLYCWRYTDPGIDEADPRKYYYYYTEERYDDSVTDLFYANPEIFIHAGGDFESNRATCFNIVHQDGSTISEMGEESYISRYEAGDIDTFVPKSYTGDEFDYKYFVTKMHCKEATKMVQDISCGVTIGLILKMMYMAQVLQKIYQNTLTALNSLM